MVATRLIARLDIKAPNLIKGVNLEGVRKIGDPWEHARRYYDDGIDEIIYMDVVASLYDRNGLADLVSHTSGDVFIPLTVGGGIRSAADVETMLRAGADKVAINTAAIARPALVDEVSQRFGAQCMVLSIEAKQAGDGRWEAYTNNGRDHTGRDVIAWATEGVARGAGEILLTSVDREGTRRGFDIDLTRAVAEAVSVPLIASGGMGSSEHLVSVVHEGKADAAAMADILHYKRSTVGEIRAAARDGGIDVRTP